MKLQLLIFLFYCVYYVFGETSFIPKGRRAEIFELTDNEVPVFRITLPNDEFELLKNKATYVKIANINIFNIMIKTIVEEINKQNFYEIFPGVNFKEILPELPIDENGHPNIDYKKYINDISNYAYGLNGNFIKFIFNTFNNDSYINLMKVFHTLSDLDVSSEVDTLLLIFINGFGKNIRMTEDGKLFLYGEKEHGVNDVFLDIPGNDDYFGYFYNYDAPNYDDDDDDLWNFDSPSSSWNTDSPNNSWNTDSPNNSWNYDLPNDIADNSGLSSIGLTEMLLGYLARIIQIDDNNNLNSLSQNVDDNDNLNSPSQNVDDNSNLNSPNQNVDEISLLYNSTISGFGKFTSKDFEEYLKNYDFDNINNFNFISEEDLLYEFKTKNATLMVEINNEKKAFNKITFSLAGQYSRQFARPGFNLKIRGGNELYGRRQFKLRGDAFEPSYMRSKLVSDIRNRIGMASLSATYTTLYINDEYFGLYILTDVYKESWIEYVYGEKDTELLYKCNYCNLDFDYRYGFENENKEATNKKELYEFLAKMSLAKSASDVESIFDLDQFYKEIAVDLLVSSWDHLVHNYYLYKNKDKWIYLSYDYDLDMGINEGPTYRIDSFFMVPVIKKLILNDNDRFKEILKEIVENVFNPATLYPHIDEIKSFIRPYVKLDKTPDENGQYPGRINKANLIFYSFEQWEDSIEFKNLGNLYALKKFILLKYRIICKDYELECDPIYIDMNYGKSLNNTDSTIDESTDKNHTTEIDFENELKTSSPSIENTTTSISKIIPTSSTDVVDHVDNDDNAPIKCLSELIGYPCCSSKLTTIYSKDEYGEWSYDFSKKEWCGLTKYESTSSQENEEQEPCWSEKLGYPCCIGCKVYEKDSNGEWGYELNHWCGIVSSHCQNNKK